MAQVRVLYNTPCLKCKCVEKEMVHVGPLPFCNKDYEEVFTTEFPDGDVVPSDSPVYLHWLKIYKEL